MIWANWSDFWSMGGRGLYVWGSFGMTFLFIGFEIVTERYLNQRQISTLNKHRHTANDRSPSTLVIDGESGSTSPHVIPKESGL